VTTHQLQKLSLAAICNVYVLNRRTLTSCTYAISYRIRNSKLITVYIDRYNTASMKMTKVNRQQLFHLNNICPGRYLFQLPRLAFLVLLADILMTSSAHSHAISFKPVSYQNGSAACESLEPSLSLSIYDPGMAAICPVFEGVPRVVCCAYFCTISKSLVDNCVGFNYRWNVDQCDFHTSVMASSFSTQTGCTYYSVGGVHYELSIGIVL